MDFDPKSSTREQIAAAYRIAVEEIEEKARLMETPTILAERASQVKKAESVEELLKLSILNEDVTREYMELGQQINERKAGLEKLYGIALSEHSVEAVDRAVALIEECYDIETSRSESEYKEAFEKQQAETRSKEEEEQTVTESRISGIEDELERLSSESKQSAEREQAEYSYTLKRERKHAEENRLAEVKKREDELRQREESAKESKAALLKRLDEIALMQAEVDAIPNKTETARQEGIKAAEKRLGKEYAYTSTLEKKEYEHKTASLQYRYDRLLEKYKELREEKNAISERLAQCNAESRMLTSDTVRSIGGINILGPEKRMRQAAEK
ncbi:MAG: hypothetical protein J6O70_02810 [Lachnospiraceae bacterium]|nr:hypothetical protein [Lachnospiraceae bacterium]